MCLPVSAVDPCLSELVGPRCVEIIEAMHIFIIKQNCIQKNLFFKQNTLIEQSFPVWIIRTVGYLSSG